MHKKHWQLNCVQIKITQQFFHMHCFLKLGEQMHARPSTSLGRANQVCVIGNGVQQIYHSYNAITYCMQYCFDPQETNRYFSFNSIQNIYICIMYAQKAKSKSALLSSIIHFEIYIEFFFKFTYVYKYRISGVEILESKEKLERNV